MRTYAAMDDETIFAGIAAKGNSGGAASDAIDGDTERAFADGATAANVVAKCRQG
jgi:hypothetical protein